MNKTILLSSMILTALVASGCTQSTPPAATAPVDTLTATHSEFVQQFEWCRADNSACDLDRDAVIAGTITKVYEPDIWEFSNFVDILGAEGNTSTIPILPDTQQKRSTIIVSQTWEIIVMDDVNVWDVISAQVKSFDRIENGELTEKLGQYWYIQITKE